MKLIPKNIIEFAYILALTPSLETTSLQNFNTINYFQKFPNYLKTQNFHVLKRIKFRKYNESVSKLLIMLCGIFDVKLFHDNVLVIIPALEETYIYFEIMILLTNLSKYDFANRF